MFYILSQMSRYPIGVSPQIAAGPKPAPVRRLPVRALNGPEPFNFINGSELLQQRVGDSEATPDDLDALAGPDEAAWLDEQACPCTTGLRRVAAFRESPQ